MANSMKATAAIGFVIMNMALAAMAETITYSEDATITEARVLTEDTEIEVAAGVTVTYSGAITSAEGVTAQLVKTGAGTLILKNANNSFSGGVKAAAGFLVAQEAGCLGTQTLTLDGGQVRFDVKGATFANPIVLARSYEGPTDPDNGNTAGSGLQLYFNKDVTFTGGITGEGLRLRMGCNRINGSSNGNVNWAVVTFNCEVNMGANGTISFHANGPYGAFKFNEKVTCQHFDCGTAWSAMGRIYFHAENAIGKYTQDSSLLYIHHADALKGAEFYHVRCWDSGRGTMYVEVPEMNIGFFNATTGRSSDDGPSSSGKDGADVTSESQSAYTVRITGSTTTPNPVSYVRFRKGATIIQDVPDGAAESFVQTYDYVPSPMTGAIVVKGGTMHVKRNAGFPEATSIEVAAGAVLSFESTADAELAKIKSLKIAGTFDASAAVANPFSELLDELELAAGASVKLPAGSVVRTKSMKIGGSTYSAGYFTEVKGVELENTTIAVVDLDPTATWTGAAGDELLTTAGNWDSTVDFNTTTVRPAFASAGSVATVNQDVIISGITFDSAQDFTLARSESPKTITVFNDITVAGNGATAQAPRTYTIDNPLKIRGSIEITSPNYLAWRLVLKDAFCSDDAVNGTIKASKPRLTFEGTNTLAGRLEITTNRVIIKNGELRNPDRARGTRPASLDDPNAIYMNFSKGSELNGGLQLQNAVIDKSLAINNRIRSSVIYAPNNTTNELRGFVRFFNVEHHYLDLREKSETTLSGGLEAVHSFRIYNGGGLRIKNIPAVFTGYAGLNPSAGTVYLDVANNTITNMCIGYNNKQIAKIVTTVDYAMTNGNVQVGGQWRRV